MSHETGAERALKPYLDSIQKMLDERKKRKRQIDEKRVKDLEEAAGFFFEESPQDSEKGSTQEGLYDMVLPAWVPPEIYIKAAKQTSTKIGRRWIKGNVIADFGVDDRTQLSDVEKKAVLVARGSTETLARFKEAVRNLIEVKTAGYGRG